MSTKWEQAIFKSWQRVHEGKQLRPIGYLSWPKKSRIGDAGNNSEREQYSERIFHYSFLNERERIFLKRLRQNRDEENELMKGVAGWETGTLWGEPVFHNVRGRFIRPSLREMLVHMDPKDQYNYIWDKMDR